MLLQTLISSELASGRDISDLDLLLILLHNAFAQFLHTACGSSATDEAICLATSVR